MLHRESFFQRPLPFVFTILSLFIIQICLVMGWMLLFVELFFSRWGVGSLVVVVTTEPGVKSPTTTTPHPLINSVLGKVLQFISSSSSLLTWGVRGWKGYTLKQRVRKKARERNERANHTHPLHPPFFFFLSCLAKEKGQRILTSK